MSTTRKRSLAAVLVVGVLWLGVAAVANAAPTSSEAGALRVVREYLAALDRRDARGVCATFAPQLRTFLLRAEFPTAPKNCRGVVLASLKLHGRPAWAGVRVVHVGAVELDPLREIEAVHLVLAERYRCSARIAGRRRCHLHTLHTSDIVYVGERAARWEIVKPGRTLRSILVEPAPGFEESLIYPPGDAASVLGPALIGAPQFTCPSASVTASDPPGDVQSESYKAVLAPWLDLLRFGISDIDASTRCFSLQLAAPPRPDSQYTLAVADPRLPEPIGFMELQIDGLGYPHVLLLGRDVARLPAVAKLVRIGLVGETLELALSKPLLPAKLGAILASASSLSLQPEEPLIVSPISAEDAVPRPGCLSYPSGKLTFRGMCDFSGPSG
jgi:hypothetical protein